MSDADLQIKKLEHDVQTLAKEKTVAVNFVANLEKQYEWIADEHECVHSPINGSNGIISHIIPLRLQAVWKAGLALRLQ